MIHIGDFLYGVALALPLYLLLDHYLIPPIWDALRERLGAHSHQRHRGR